jgi:hypothetical protein
MRMRKLGKGQSVVFCSSMEVRRSISESGKKHCDLIEVADVLKWCIGNTCDHTRKIIPLWATQGLRHQHRRRVYANAIGGPSKELVEELLEPEAQSLQQRYGDAAHHTGPRLPDDTAKTTQNEGDGLRDIEAKCQEFEVTSLTDASLQEEQERELSPENEREQQVERPLPLSPCPHILHEDVRQLVTKGVLIRSSAAFRPAFETFRRTTASDFYEATAWPGSLLVTYDFTKTVQANDEQLLDMFLRPVHWVMSCRVGNSVQCVIISPHEAQELLPTIRQSKHATLALYSPRLTVSMRSFEHLSFCVPPTALQLRPDPSIIRQLNIFAGQLYIQSYEDYELVCAFLGLCSHPPGDHITVGCDGFINLADRLDIVHECPFTTSPVAFVRMIIELRRKGQSFATSHLGRILNGELIVRKDF